MESGMLLSAGGDEAVSSEQTTAEFLSPSSYFATRAKVADPIFMYKGGKPQFSYYRRFLEMAVWKPSEREALVTAVQDQTGPTGSSSQRTNVDTSTAVVVASDTNSDRNIDWDQVATRVGGGKAPMECLMQYRNVDDPRLHSQPWAQEEVSRLVTFVRDHGYNWAACAEAVGNNRTPFQCISYYQVCLRCIEVYRYYY